MRSLPRALACALLLALLTATGAGAAVSSATDRARALAAYAAMQRAYYSPASGLYRDHVSSYANAWPYSQAMAATISLAALPGMHGHYRPDLQARLRGLEAYADRSDAAPAGYSATIGAPLGSGGQRYNDDNEWIGIELVRLFHVDHDAALLLAAARQYTLVYSQWDQAAGIACPGGVPWRTLTPGTTRNTVSNATGAELGAQLYMRTGTLAYLQGAEAMYGWVRGCMLGADGLYIDHVGDDGTLDTNEWTYNQGTMIGAGVMLYQATHQQLYLQQAVATANTALATYTPQMLAQEPVSFDAIYVRNMLLLGAATGDRRYRSFAAWFAGDEWSNVRDPVSGLFLADPAGATQLIDQAAMVQVYALLASAPATYF